MSARAEFWEIICSHAPYFYVMLVVVTAMAVLNLFVMILGTQSAGTFAVSLLVFAILGITGLGLAAVLWQCSRR
ncbi:hypothetical protein ACLI4Z_05720 [Natrialbaceae archaeon A-arb3/5]